MPLRPIFTQAKCSAINHANFFVTKVRFFCHQIHFTHCRKRSVLPRSPPQDRPPPDRPKFRSFFPLPPSLSCFFSLSLGVFSWNLPPGFARTQTPPKFHERTSREREKKINNEGGGEGKTSAKFWAPNPSGPNPSGPTFSEFGAATFKPHPPTPCPSTPYPSAPTFSTFRPPTSVQRGVNMQQQYHVLHGNSPDLETQKLDADELCEPPCLMRKLVQLLAVEECAAN